MNKIRYRSISSQEMTGVKGDGWKNENSFRP